MPVHHTTVGTYTLHSVSQFNLWSVELVGQLCVMAVSCIFTGYVCFDTEEIYF